MIFKSEVANGKFIGIDPVPRMVEIATERTENHEARERIEYRVGSAKNLPIDDGVVDYVLAFDSIDPWQDVEKGFLEVRRVVKASGAFAIKATKKISKEGVEFYLVICRVGN